MDGEKWAKAMEEVEAELEKVRRRLLLAEDFDEMEAVAAEMGPEIERMVPAAGVEQREGVGEQRCPECGGKLKVEGRAKRQLKTSRGVVKYRRRRWVCESCGATIFPPGSGAGDRTVPADEPPAWADSVWSRDAPAIRAERTSDRGISRSQG